MAINRDFIAESCSKIMAEFAGRPRLGLIDMVNQARRIMAMPKLTAEQAERLLREQPGDLSERSAGDHLTAADARLRAAFSTGEHSGLDAGERQQREEAVLRQWAAAEGLLFPQEAFTALWKMQGSIAGMEHQVVLDAATYSAQKRKMLWHTETWRDCLDRLLIHNHLFPYAAYVLRGFTLAAGTSGKTFFMARVDQPFIEGRSASLAEIKPLMASLGFEKISEKFGGEWSVPGSGIRLMDLNRQNVLVSPGGSVAVIDPRIEFEGPDVREVLA